MNDKKPTIVDIYEASGWDVNEARTQATNGGTKPPKPFKIEILVLPRSVTSQYGQEDVVEFDVLMDDTRYFEKTPMGTAVYEVEHYGSFAMPVSQVKIVQEDKEN